LRLPVPPPPQLALTLEEYLYGGSYSLLDSTVGFTAFSPVGTGSPFPPYSDPSIALISPSFSKTVRAIAYASSRFYIGGQFLDVSSNRVGYIVSSDGRSFAPLGVGVDGAVYALATCGDRVVVGGAFSRVYQSEGVGSLETGSFAVWNTT
jgi:hypothetical protein